MRVLFVCTANICRSPSGAQLLLLQLPPQSAEPVVEVSSAGVWALAGEPGCAVAPALQPDAWRQHSARVLTAELVRDADLVLVASREHRTAVVGLDVTARRRTFTILQAGRIARWMTEPGGIIDSGRERATNPGSDADWADRFPVGDPRAGVPALPVTAEQRWQWLVAEMDAARGMVAASPPEAPPKERRSALARLLGGVHAEPQVVPHPDDLIDPHVAGSHLHEQVDRQLRAAVAGLFGALVAVGEVAK